MRLIDAYALKESILKERDKIPRTVPAAPYELVKEKPYNHGNSMRGGIRKALRCLEECPTVDAVPVVRCKDCKYRVKNSTTIGGKPFIYYTCSNINGLQEPFNEYFCSYGDRRNADDNN